MVPRIGKKQTIFLSEVRIHFFCRKDRKVFIFEIINEYLKLFRDTSHRPGSRVFRKILVDKRREMYASEQKLGKHTCTALGKDIAEFLKLESPNQYTGQCWRHTSATILAEHGWHHEQIMGITGHKSERVVKGYIANSDKMLKQAGTALSFGDHKDSSCSSSNFKSCRTEKRSSPSTNQFYITLNNSSVTGDIRIVQNRSVSDEED